MRQVASDAASNHAERRRVTALFYDIVSSTELMARMDPEDYRDLQRAVHISAAAEIRSRRGYLEHVLGDGGFAYFGFPDAIEAAPEAAVAAALAIVAQFKAEVGETARALRLRVGVASGIVVLSNLIGDDLPRQEEIVGDAPIIAARIQALAQPNTVAVSDETYRQTIGLFHYEPLGAHSLKGFLEPVTLWRPTAPLLAGSRFLATRDRNLPFFSRKGEMELALDRWRLAETGLGQTIVIEGEAGIGKSRFLHELQRRTGIGSGDTHLIQFSETDQATPLAPILAWARASGNQQVQAPLLGAGAALPDLEARSQLLSLMDAGTVEVIRPDIATDLRARAVDGACRAILAAAGPGPQLVIMEDLHWGDSLSRDAAIALAERIRSRPAMLCVSTRDHDLAGLADESNATVIRLGRLDSRSTSDLVGSIWDGTAPEGLAALVHEKSDGVPLYVEELARLLHDLAPGPEAGPAGWQALIDAGAPGLHDLLDTRLARLGSAKRVAQAASVIGRDFDRGLLAGLIDDPPEIGLDEAILQLIAAGIFQEPVLGHGRQLRFRHVLLRDAAYRSLLRRERRTLHGRLAQLLQAEAASGLSGGDLDLAFHLHHAGDLAGAIEHLARAARYAASRSALAEADELVARATALLPHLDDTQAQRRLALRIAAIEGPVAAMLAGTGSPRARKVYSDGIALCEQLPPAERQEWFSIYWGWWYTAPNVGVQHRRAKVIIDVFATGTADREVRLQAHHCAWAAGYHVGDHATCARAIAGGLALYDAEAARSARDLYGGHDTRVCGLGERAQSAWCTGDDALAVESIAAALAWATEIDHLGSLCHALDMQCLVHFYRHDFPAMRQAATSLAELADRHRLSAATAKAQIYLGWVRAIGDIDPVGGRELAEGLAALRRIETEEDFPLYLGMRGEAELAAGDAGAALATLAEAMAQSERSSNLVWLAELHRLKALAARDCGRDAAVCLRSARTAAEVAAGQGAWMLVLRALTTAAALAERTADRTAVADELARTVAHVRAGRDLQLARAALAALRAA